jgi:hypothetical protein
MAMEMLITFFCVVTLCELVGKYQCFSGINLQVNTALQPTKPRLKMEAVCSSETLVSICKFTQCYNPEDQHQ